MEQLTAAHRRLPFQTWVEVTNLSNGKQVDVRINDRGPFVKGRIIDLSQAAAREIDMLRAGTARVRLKVIPPPSIADRGNPSARTSADASRTAPCADPIAAVSVASDATVRRSLTRQPSRPSVVTPSKPEPSPIATAPNPCAPFSKTTSPTPASRLERTHASLWRVIVGREMTREQATELAIRVRQEAGAAVVVPEPEPVPRH